MQPYVLVVEDDSDVRDILCEVIRDAGLEVVPAEDGSVALRYLEKHPPPFLVLLDLMMPIMDGRQFRSVQRADPRLAQIPVVVLSADRRVEATGELEGTQCINKPVELSKLLDLLESHRP